MRERLPHECYWRWRSRFTLIERLENRWPRFWMCRVRRMHQVELNTAPPCCYRCGKPVVS